MNTLYKDKKFNTILFTVILALSAIIEIRLLVAAQETANWRGFFYSSLHVLIVAGGTWLAIRKKEEVNL